MIEERRRWQRLNDGVSYFETPWKRKSWDQRFRLVFGMAKRSGSGSGKGKGWGIKKGRKSIPAHQRRVMERKKAQKKSTPDAVFSRLHVKDDRDEQGVEDGRRLP